MYGGGEGAYRTYCLEAFEAFIDRADYAHEILTTYDPNDIFYWEHRMGMWGSAMLNEMDAALLSLVGFNSRPLYASAFGLPPEERFTKALLLAITARFNPKLADLPVV